MQMERGEGRSVCVCVSAHGQLSVSLLFSPSGPICWRYILAFSCIHLPLAASVAFASICLGSISLQQWAPQETVAETREKTHLRKKMTNWWRCWGKRQPRKNGNYVWRVQDGPCWGKRKRRKGIGNSRSMERKERNASLNEESKKWWQKKTNLASSILQVWMTEYASKRMCVCVCQFGSFQFLQLAVSCWFLESNRHTKCTHW